MIPLSFSVSFAQKIPQISIKNYHFSHKTIHFIYIICYFLQKQALAKKSHSYYIEVLFSKRHHGSKIVIFANY